MNRVKAMKTINQIHLSIINLSHCLVIHLLLNSIKKKTEWFDNKSHGCNNQSCSTFSPLGNST